MKEFDKHGYQAHGTHHDVMVEDIFNMEDEDEDNYPGVHLYTRIVKDSLLKVTT